MSQFSYIGPDGKLVGPSSPSAGSTTSASSNAIASPFDTQAELDSLNKLIGVQPQVTLEGQNLILATAVSPGAKGAGQSVDIVCSGDITAALTAAIAALGAGNGGTISLSAGSGYCTAQLAIPNDGTAFVNGVSAPLQKSIRITGQGAGDVGDRLLSLDWTAPLGGTILDLRYAAGPKILTTGSGRFELDHLSLIDTTDGTQDFIHVGLTTLKARDVTFFGKTADTPIQDAIVLGVPITFIGFQTTIENCTFGRIRRGVYGKMYCNSTIIRQNTWGCGCGGTAAIELDGTGGFCNGNVIVDNLIEMSNGPTGSAAYSYAVKLGPNCTQNYMSNSFYDPQLANSVAYYTFDTTAINNIVVDVYSAGKALLWGNGRASQRVIASAGQDQMPHGLTLNGAGSVYSAGTPVFRVTTPTAVAIDMGALASGTFAPWIQTYFTVNGNPYPLLINPNGGDVILGGVVATNATAGMLTIPKVAGSPSGVPAAGAGTMVYDTSAHKLWIYDTSWKALTPA